MTIKKLKTKKIKKVLASEETIPAASYDEEALVPQKGYWANVFRLFFKNKIAVLGLCILAVILTLCIFAPLFTQWDPILDMNLPDATLRPGAPGHPLGTDDLGRDIWSRLLYGGRTSVATGLAITLLSSIIGVSLGLIAGYSGGFIETLIMRATDIMLSFPMIVIAIAIMAALGSNQRNVIISLAIVSWPGFCRLTRGQVLALRNMEYIEASRTIGFNSIRIIFRHVLPNCMGPLIIQMTLAVGGAILSAATLSYLGLGADAAAPDWGIMLSQGKNHLRLASYLTTIPGIAISITVLAMNWIGDGLRDAFDPKLRK